MVVREIPDRAPLRSAPMRSPPPRIGDEVRRRLTARFGDEVGPWFEELRAVLGVLAERWQIDFGPLIPRGSMSVVIRCQTADGRPAVLKISPDRLRLANEASALESWATVHTPTVLAVDESVGAVLLEAIEPGVSLAESATYPRLEIVSELLTSLHATGFPDPSYPPLAERIAYLFDSGTKPYTRRPELIELVPPELYERGRQLANRLVEHVSPTALLHGDLTPSNILDGGNGRGFVAIDPAPCLGDDLGFEAIDLVLWRADDVDLIGARAEQLAPAIGVDARRLLDWCTAFAAMTALELAEASDSSPERIRVAVTLASRAPSDPSG
jgi:streptomycin 6-kinase